MNKKDKQELLEELEEKFEKAKSEIGFKASFDEVERIFFINDAILKSGFVSESFSRQLCSRMVETYHSWLSYYHGLVMPNPQNIINLNESKFLDQEDKKGIMNMMSKIISLTDRNNLIGLTKDKKEEAKFIDDAVEFWNSEFEAFSIKVMQKIVDGWK